MADFDLVQTDAQVQSILNDGQSAMGASAQTTLTTEYVMLKDTNGVYHKILKSSFAEAIRDTRAGLLVNNDKGTTINQIAAIASGDFGSITPANLASVLGGLQQFNGSGLDADNITVTGVYANSDNMTNMPTVDSHPNGAWGSLIHIESQYRIQIYCGGTTNVYGYYIRYRTGSAWRTWKQI